MTGHDQAMFERVRLARTLSGDGLEIGPGNAPLPVGKHARVRFVERPYALGGYRDAHDLAGPNAVADSAVLTLDVDAEGLSPIKDSSLDFVIACHVIEHLANPLRFLAECARTIRQDGKLLLIVPDRERTFDFGRPGTPISHVVEEFQTDVRSVDDDHIENELRHALGLPEGGSVDPREVEQWRELTVHAHCWTAAEFVALLVHATDQTWLPFALEDCYFPEHHAQVAGFEFGVLLRRDELRYGRVAAESMLEDFTLHVAARAPGERPRWSRIIQALMDSKLVNLPWTVDPDALFDIILHQAMGKNAAEATSFFADPIGAIERVAAHPSAPTGLGRSSAYWRGILAGRNGLVHPLRASEGCNH